jgi:mono/diheme cytochrome c family protein
MVIRSLLLAFLVAALIGGPAAADTDAGQIKRGEYLVHASDCVACHTVPGGDLMAGRRPLPTPFGTLYSSNITPDPDYGIGKWTADQFYSMMHTGRSLDGGLIYPAMPFAAYTKMTRQDIDAIFAYLKSIPAIHKPDHEQELRFPYDNRSLLIGWRTLYFEEGEYKPDPSKSEDWNRGAYLVQGPGHCSMCHTAINALGGSSDSQAFEGGLIPLQNWYAPSLTSNAEAGLGDWSVEEIADLLRTGSSARGAVYGPMADVVYNSLQYMTADDSRAMAVYLKSLAQRTAPGGPPPVTSAAEDSLLVQLGKTVYDAKCASCHGAKGEGKPPEFPPLAHNPSIEMAYAVNPIRMVLNGGYPPATAGNPRPYGMPPFAQALSDDEVAAVVTYIRVSWGNHGEPVSARQANDLRSATLN